MILGGLALLLVAATGVCSAGFDIYQKLLSRTLTPVQMVFWLGIASTPLFGIGVAAVGLPDVETTYWWPAGLSVLLNLAGHIAFVEAVKVSDLSKTVPLLSLTPVFTTLIGVWVLGERPEGLVWIGILLVVAGAFWLHAAKGVGPWNLIGVLRERGAWLMVATTLAWSISIPLDKLAVERADALFHGLVLTLGMTVGAWFVLVVTRRPIAAREVRWQHFVAALFLCTGALAFQLLALTQAIAGVVETGKRCIGNFMALVFGQQTFGEKIDFHRWSAVTAMALGVALILLRGGA